MKFVIPLKPESWNNIVGKNRWVYQKIKDTWERETFYAIKAARLKPQNGPCRVIFTARYKERRRHDLDNIFVKKTMDCMVKQGIFPDDNLTIVMEVIFHGQVGCERDELIVEIEPFQFYAH
ncbi:MAG: RusA family crossover junction endodeoxyribonuclease [Patescibacteria group bacterium]|jgi:Holliday junction resolvase RusA-like endonuclease